MKKNLLKISTLMVLMILAIGVKTFAQNLTSTKAPAPIEMSSKAVLLTESFDAATYPPTGWLNVAGSGTYLWTRVTAGTYPVCTTHSGAAMSCYNTFSISSGNYASLISPVVNLTGNTGLCDVRFWMFHDAGYATSMDKIDCYVNTTASLTGATLLGTANRPTGTGWLEHVFTIPAAFNTATNYIIFKATSAYGNDIYMDDVSVNSPSANDCGVIAILAPNSMITPGAVVPQVTVKNFGTAAQTNLPVKYKIGVGGTVVTQTVASLAAGATTNVSFPSWTAANGTYDFIFYTDLTGDAARINDTMKRTVSVTDVVWTNGAATTLSSYMGSAAACGGKVYCMGGNQTAAAGTGVAIYDVTANTWTAGPVLPLARVIGMGAATSTKVYMIGGNDGAAYQSTIWELTPPGTTWTVKTPLPAVLGWADAVTYQDSLVYIIGGYNGTASQTTVYLYNNVNNTVRLATPLPVATGMGGAAGITGNTIVLTAGLNAAATTLSAVTYRGVINATNRATIVWTTGADIPGLYFRTDGGSWGPNEIIVTNGSNTTAWTPATPCPTYVYNPTTNVWRTLAPKTTPTLGAYIATLNSSGNTWKLVAASGYTGAACTPNTEILSETFGVGITTNSSATFSIYPNPVSDRLNIASDKVINKINVYNVSGQLVYSSIVKDLKTEINTSSFSNGMYMVQIESEDGISVQKFNVAK